MDTLSPAARREVVKTGSGGDAFDLARVIAPVSVETFLADHFEKSVLVVNREDRDYYKPLLSIDDIDWIVTTLNPSNSEISMTDAKRELKPDDYSYPSGMIDPTKLAALFTEGATVIMPGLHMRLPPLADLTRSLEREFGSRFQTNIYLTPAGQAQGFKPHYDNHDVLVLQIHGSKAWKIYDTPVTLPHRGQQFDPGAYELGPVTQEFVLKAGDLAYVPRGVVHDAVSTDEESLHITVGVLSRTWTDLLVEAVTLASIREPDMRHSLPYGFTSDEFDRTEARKTFKNLLDRLSDLVDADEMLDQFVDDMITTRHSLVWGQLAQAQRAASLTLDDEVGARPNLMYRLTRMDDRVHVLCYGANIDLPDFAEPALRFAMETPSFRIADLPGDLDDTGKLVLIRRLIREGLVQAR